MACALGEGKGGRGTAGGRLAAGRGGRGGGEGAGVADGGGSVHWGRCAWVVWMAWEVGRGRLWRGL